MVCRKYPLDFIEAYHLPALGTFSKDIREKQAELGGALCV